MVPSVYFSFFCLLVSSVSNFCPDTRGRWWSHFLGSLVQSCCGEGGTLQTNNTGVCSHCLSHTGFSPGHSVCSSPVYTAQALGCSAGNCPRLALGCMHLPGLSHSGSGTQVVLRGADSVGPAFVPFPGPSSSGGEVMARAIAATYRLSRPCHSLFWVYNRHIFSQMSTVQNPEKSWLATKPACSLVDDASLGLQLPPSGSGCSRLPVSSGGWASPQPASSSLSFVL